MRAIGCCVDVRKSNGSTDYSQRNATHRHNERLGFNYTTRDSQWNDECSASIETGPRRDLSGVVGTPDGDNAALNETAFEEAIEAGQIGGGNGLSSLEINNRKNREECLG